MQALCMRHATWLLARLPSMLVLAQRKLDRAVMQKAKLAASWVRSWACVICARMLNAWLTAHPTYSSNIRPLPRAFARRSATLANIWSGMAPVSASRWSPV